MAQFLIEEIIEATGGRCIQSSSRTNVKNVVIDSRLVRDGYAFVAIKGVKQDGHKYIKRAIDNGASVVIVSKLLKRYHQNLSTQKSSGNRHKIYVV